MSIKRTAQNPLVCHGHTRPIVELSYSPVTPDGYFLVSASKDGQPMLRNGETGDWIGTFQGHKGAVWSCVLDDSAMLAATASADFTARIWDALSGDEKHQFQHKHIVRTVQFSRDGRHLVTGGHEKLLRLYDMHQPDAPPMELAGATSTIRCAAFHQNDTVVLSSSGDKPGITVWDTRTLSAVRTLETSDPVTSIEVVPGGQHISTADGRHSRFWDGASLTERKVHKSSYGVESVTYNPAKGRFATGGEDMWVRLYDYQTGEEVEVNKGHHGPVHCVRFAPGGVSYASGSEDGTIRIWQTDYQDQGDSKQPTANGTNHAAE